MTKRSQDVLVPTESYLRELQAEWDAAREKALAQGERLSHDDARRSRQTNWRVFQPDKTSMKAALRFAQALNERGVDMPPPGVAIRDRADYDWIVIGRTLRAASPELFAKIMGTLRPMSRASAELLSADAELETLVVTETQKTSTVPTARR